jgi:hypothetical protein
MDETNFAICYSSAVARGPCAKCGFREKPQGDLALCVKDLGLPICGECGYQYAPRLQFCLDAYYTDRDARSIPEIRGRYVELLAEAARYGIHAYFEREEAANREAIEREHELE